MKRLPALVLNPFVTLGSMESEEDAIQILAPVRNKKILRTPIDPIKDHEEYSLLVKWVDGGFPTRIEADLCPGKIRNSGLFLSRELIPRTIPFKCGLEKIENEIDQWRDNDRMVILANKKPDDIILNPTLRLDKKTKSRIWVKDPFTGCPFPLDLTDYHRKLVSKLQHGTRKARGLSARIRELYLICRILVPHRSKENRRALETEINSLIETLRSDRYAVIPGILSPPQIIHMRHYFEQMIQEGFFHGDVPKDPTKRRCFVKDDPIGRVCLEGFTPFFSHLLERKIKPSLFFLLEYQAGEKLGRHRDAPESSEVTVSIQLYNRKKGRLSENQWPLKLENKKLCVDAGDGVVFLGQELYHSRTPLSKGEKSGVILFSYHDKAYTGEVK